MKQIILCADDYGQNQAISQAIIKLIEKNRLSATSCLTNSENWLITAKWLEPYKQQIDIGLHLNFTEGSPLSSGFIDQYGERFISLPTLMLKSHLRILKKRAIVAEIHAQLDRFNDVMQMLPNFIDGHQHIHQFPIIRECLLAVYDQRLKATNCYIRNIATSLNQVNFSFKKIILQLSGARTLKRQLVALGIPHNASFSGIYNFTNKNSYSSDFKKFMTEISDQGLIMCHPGLHTDHIDKIAQSRLQEYQYLSSDEFTEDCIKAKVRLHKNNAVIKAY